MKEQKIRILAVAPYEGLKALMKKVCGAEFPEIELTILVGNWKEGLDTVQKNFHEGFDAIISRGGTALLLRQQVDLPVIDIPLTAYDILRAQRLTNGLSDRYAIVGFPNMAKNAEVLNEILKLNMDIYSYDMPVAPNAPPEGLYVLLENLRAKGYRAILGDNSAAAAAKQLGMNAVMLSSGIESIREAFNSAIQLCSSTESLRNENLFLRRLLQEQDSKTIVFDQNRNLYFSTFSASNAKAVEELLCTEVENISKTGAYRFTKQLNGSLYIGKAHLFEIGSASYAAFHFVTRKVASSSNLAGISYCSATDLQVATQDSFYGIIENAAGLPTAIDLVEFSNSPILLMGEYGMELKFAAAAICLSSRLKNTPIVFIDCALLSNQSWDYLMNHHNSPLNLTDRTIYFHNADALSAEKRNQLISSFVSSNLWRRNHLLLSCTCQYGAVSSAVGDEIMEALPAQLFNIPPLRKLRGQLSQLINMCLMQLNTNLPVEIYGVEDEEISLLQEYDWPHNFSQLRRILSALATSASDQLIRTDAVRNLLQEEQSHSYSACAAFQTSLNLNGTLEEITQEVLRFVLVETGGNQTAAAKRLGIGRTTLWRMLKSHEANS